MSELDPQPTVGMPDSPPAVGMPGPRPTVGMPDPPPTVGMPGQRPPDKRVWLAPSLGTGLVVAGVAMALGMSSRYGPLLGAAVAGVLIAITTWLVPTLRRPR